MTSPNEPTTDNKNEINKNNTLPILLPNPNSFNKSTLNLSDGSSDLLDNNKNLLNPIQKNEKKNIKKAQKKEPNMLYSSKTASRREADRLRKAKSRSNPANAVFEASRERVKRHVKNKYKFIDINTVPILDDLPRRQPCHDLDIYYHISPYEDPQTIDLNEKYYNSGIKWPKYVQDIMKFISNQNQNIILKAVKESSCKKYKTWVSELKEKKEELKLLFEAKIYYHQRRESDYKESWAKYCETGKATKEDIDSYHLRLQGLEHNLMENRRIAKEFWEKNEKYFDVETVSVILSNTPTNEKITITIDKNSLSKKDHEKSKTRKPRNSSSTSKLIKIQPKSSNKPPITLKPTSSILNSVLPQLAENISNKHYNSITENINDKNLNDMNNQNPNGINNQTINGVNDHNIFEDSYSSNPNSSEEKIDINNNQEMNENINKNSNKINFQIAPNKNKLETNNNNNNNIIINPDMNIINSDNIMSINNNNYNFNRKMLYNINNNYTISFNNFNNSINNISNNNNNNNCINNNNNDNN
ncbi:hypothetical protein U3516DRAFT_610833, partial [Neocallimastix sp. 'constans']